MIPRIVEFSVTRRWWVLLVSLTAALLGAWALAKLPIDAVPDITNNQVQVNITAPALAPLELEQQVTWPLETALAGMVGMESTRSLTRHGFAQITVVFSDDTDIYFARQQLGERLNAATDTLPPGIDVEMGPIATGLSDIYMWTLEYVETHDIAPHDGEPGLQTDGSYLTASGQRLVTEREKATWLRTVQDWIVTPQLKAHPGLAGVDVIGGYVRQLQVTPDVQQLAAMGLSLPELAAILERANTSVGMGVIERHGQSLTVQASARIHSADELAQTVIATRNGMPVQLQHVATVEDGQAVRFGSASENGREVVIGTAVMRIGENSHTLAHAVDANLQEIARTLPADLIIRPVLDRTELIDAAIWTVSKNLTEGALLVIVVLFALLGNFRAALIAALVIPLTMLLTAMGMLKSGVSANLMSLGALDFGLIVDGAVIIVENALRRIAERQQELGRTLTREERQTSVAAAAREMIRPSVFGQAIIILVYVPLLSFQGVEGRMFAPMAVTVMLALVGACVLSLTFVPALIAIALNGPVREHESRAIAALKRHYAAILERTLPRPLALGACAVALVLGALLLFSRLGQEFLPQLDEGDLAVQVWRVPGTSLEQSQHMQFGVEKNLSALPEVRLVFSRTGTAELASDPMPPHSTDTFVMLHPRRAWPNPRLPKAELVERIEHAVSELPGQGYEFSQPLQLRFNELLAGVRGDLGIKVYGDDFTTLSATAEQIAAQLRQIPGLNDIRVEQVQGLPLLDVQLDRAAMARLGVQPADVFDTLSTALAGRNAGMLFEDGRRFEIMLRLPDTATQNLDTLRSLPIPLPGGGFTALASVARLTETTGPNQISRENGKRRMLVQANIRGRDLAGAVNQAQAAISEHVTLPPGVWLGWGGQFENLERARARLLIVVPACLALIALLLYSAVSSWRKAAIIFTGVPLALVGGIASLWLRGLPFSISAAVGLIALSGVAVLNGLVMASAIEARHAAVPWPDAVREGALQRLRPVLMTALVAALGFIPMALATGTGAEVQRPLATVVIGGLISSTALTLLLLPALYLRFGNVRQQRTT